MKHKKFIMMLFIIKSLITVKNTKGEEEKMN